MSAFRGGTREPGHWESGRREGRLGSSSDPQAGSQLLAIRVSSPRRVPWRRPLPNTSAQEIILRGEPGRPRPAEPVASWMGTGCRERDKATCRAPMWRVPRAHGLHRAAPRFLPLQAESPARPTPLPPVPVGTRTHSLEGSPGRSPPGGSPYLSLGGRRAGGRGGPWGGAARGGPAGSPRLADGGAQPRAPSERE